MDNYTILQTDYERFVIYHAVYSSSNQFLQYDWNERLSSLDTSHACHFIYENEIVVGGFTIVNDKVSNPFRIAHFIDLADYWTIIVEYARQVCNKDRLQFNEIPESDVSILVEHFFAKIDITQRRMIRPTDQIKYNLDDCFMFELLDKSDVPEIVETVFQAHSSGYTSTFRKPDKKEIEKAILMRIEAFIQTKSLNMSVLVKSKCSSEIVGVCIAGIYPDSPNDFSTIHQVSVRSQYRRRGIAEAMILKSIEIAYEVSPVITLGVMVGNPAEKLYKKLGFIAGPSYSNLSCAK